MKIAFLQPLPVMLESYIVLSAYLQKIGIESEVFVESFEKGFIDEVINSNSDIIGFNCLSGSYNWALHTIKKIKKIKNIPIVIGGPHPTYYPEEIDFDFIDYICIGEGEHALAELVTSIQNGCNGKNTENIGYKKNNKVVINPLRPLIKNLDDLPFPNRKLYHKYGYFLNQDMYDCRTVRGCPYKCSFCFMGNFSRLYNNRNIYREFSIDYVMQELINIKRDYKRIKRIAFADDTFGINKERTYKLLYEYKKEIGLPYRITTRTDIIDDDFVKILKETNCELVSMSVETGNEIIRKNVLNKKITNKIAIEAGRKLHKNGIRTRVNCIFCLPDETIDDAFKTIELMKQMKTPDPVAFLLQPFPKTPISEYSINKGYVKKDMDFDELDPLVYFKTPMRIPNKKKIIVIQRLFVYACKIPYFDKILRIIMNVPNNFVFEIMQKIAISLSHKQFYSLSFIGLIKYLFSARKLNIKKYEKI